MKNRKITSFESNTLRLYLNDIGRIPLLPRDEEAEIIKKVKKGNDEALRKLIMSNLRFVVTIAKEYQNSGLPLTDLICEGNVGLYKAAKRFDPSRECKFISYGVWWIRQSILQAISDQSRMIRLPVNRLAYMKKIKKLISGSDDNKSSFSFSEIAKEYKIKPEEIIKTFEIESGTVSLDAERTDGDNGKGTLLNMTYATRDLEPDYKLEVQSQKEDVDDILSLLTEKEATIVKYYFGLKGCRACTLGEIGEMLNLTRERIRQIKHHAIHKIRNSIRAGKLKVSLT